MDAKSNKENFFLLRFRFRRFYKFKNNTAIIINSTSPSASQYTLQFVAVEAGVKGILREPIQNWFDFMAQFRMMNDRSFIRSNERLAPQEGFHEDNSCIKSDTPPR